MPCDKSFESFSEDELHEIEEIMLPGEYSQCGFLKEGDNLFKIYHDDKDYLNKVGITYDQIADILEYHYGKASRIASLRSDNGGDYSGPVEYDNYKITRETWMGAQQCPFQESSDKKYYGYMYGDTDVAILNLTTNKSITFNTLLPHMIRHHHFFESPNVQHRVNPKDVIEFFDLKSGVDYSPVYIKEKYWAKSSFCGGVFEFDIFVADIFKKMDLVELKPCNDTSIFLVPFYISRIFSSVKYNLDGKHGYESVRREILEKNNRYFEKENEERIKLGISPYFDIHTDDEITQMIKNELELLDRFKKNGTLETEKCKMEMYCISNSSYDTGIDVAGINYKISRGVTRCCIGTNTYVDV